MIWRTNSMDSGVLLRQREGSENIQEIGLETDEMYREVVRHGVGVPEELVFFITSTADASMSGVRSSIVAVTIQLVPGFRGVGQIIVTLQRS